MDWSLRELRCFVTAADAGSFTDAAAQLHISQAAVSRTIAGLETIVGQRLLRRVPRGCELTNTGQQILPQARRILSESARFTEFLTSRRGILRLGYAWAALGQHTARFQRDWAQRHETIGLELIRHNSPTAGLVEGLCDVAVVRWSVDEKRFDSLVVGLERRLVAFASDDKLWARRRQVTMAEIANRTVIIDPRVGTTSSCLWSAAEHRPQFVETTDVDGWLDAIAAGRGVGVTAEATAHHHSRPGIRYRPIKDGPRIPVRLAWWRNDPPEGLSALIDDITLRFATD
ncbi:LysR family transcriptional regulator [Rhodococcus qingshengii]|uniref:LysR family transcriptional regulator n=1 Tax=Rhodococcus qingshengii TaxID=334542 RepID=UPI0036DD2445